MHVGVVRPGHAHDGQVLRVIGKQATQNGLKLRVELPDGSRSFLPAEWTDMSDRTLPESSATGIGRLSHLLHLRTVVDALCTRSDESRSVKEKRYAATSGIHRRNGRQGGASTAQVGETGRGGTRGSDQPSVAARRPDAQRDVAPQGGR